MSNNLKLIIVAIISFTCGVMATSFIGRSSLVDPILSPRQKELQEIAIEAERRPFFPNPSESRGLPLIADKSVKPISETANFDYIKLNSELEDFRKTLSLESQRKFESVNINGSIHARKKDYVLGKISALFTSRDTLFKASFNSSETESVKFTFFMRFFHCTPNGIEVAQFEKATLENTCYSFSSYSNLHDKWSYYSVISNLSTGEWKDDVYYFPFNLDEMGDAAKETNILRGYVPMADDGGLVIFLKYEKNKFEWIEAGELKWVSTNMAEVRKFEKLALPPNRSNDQ